MCVQSRKCSLGRPPAHVPGGGGGRWGGGGARGECGHLQECTTCTIVSRMAFTRSLAIALLTHHLSPGSSSSPTAPPIQCLALPGGAPEQSRKHNTSIATVVRGGMGHGVGKLLVICGIGNWLGTYDVAVPMSASDTAHSIALHTILHLKAGMLTPVGAMKHFPLAATASGWLASEWIGRSLRKQAPFSF